MSKVSREGSRRTEDRRKGRHEFVRGILTYDRRDYEVHHLSPSIKENYSGKKIEEIHEDVVLQSIERVYQESLFNDMGDIIGELRVFEDGTVAHFHERNETRGSVILVDNEVNPRIETLCEIASEYY
jgi:hypothetical protein